MTDEKDKVGPRKNPDFYKNRGFDQDGYPIRMPYESGYGLKQREQAWKEAPEGTDPVQFWGAYFKNINPETYTAKPLKSEVQAHHLSVLAELQGIVGRDFAHGTTTDQADRIWSFFDTIRDGIVSGAIADPHLLYQ